MAEQKQKEHELKNTYIELFEVVSNNSFFKEEDLNDGFEEIDRVQEMAR